MSLDHKEHQTKGPQPAEKVRKTVKRARPHTVPATLFPESFNAIGLEMSAGRNSAQVAKEHNASQFVALELFTRHELRQVRRDIANLRSSIALGRAA